MSWWVAGATVVGSVYSANSASDSADDARRASTSEADASRREQRRQFDLQRRDSEPWRMAGSNAIRDLQGNLQGGDYDPAQFSYNEGDKYSGGMPGGEPLPQFGGRDRFNFDLEGDKGYQFAKDEAIKSTNRESAAGGKYNSGNRLAAISDRVTGVASQYADQAYNRQMGASRENYGRGASEYGQDYGRNQDIYGRQVGQEASQYDRFTNREQLDYGRNMNQFGLNADRESNMYNQNQNYMNRLSSIANVGQTANQGSAAAGSNMANAIGNLNMQNAGNQIASNNNRYQGYNNALQGGISNYMTYQNSQPNQQYGTGYNNTNVQGDAYMPSQVNR